MPTYLTDSRRGLTYEWNGSHTVNILRDGEEIDCFTFGFNMEGKVPTFIDFVAAVNNHNGD